MWFISPEPGIVRWKSWGSSACCVRAGFLRLVGLLSHLFSFFLNLFMLNCELAAACLSMNSLVYSEIAYPSGYYYFEKGDDRSPVALALCTL